MGYNYTHVKTTIKRKNNLRIPGTGKDVEQLELSHTLQKKRQNYSVTLETVRQFLIKINIYLPYNSAILVQVFTQGNKNLYSKKNLYANVYNRFSHNCPKVETSRMLFNRWMDKIYTMIMKYYSTIKRNRLWFT